MNVVFPEKRTVQGLWDVLLDPTIIAQCMPGCERVKEIGPGFIQGEMTIDLDGTNGETVLKYSTDAKVGGLIAGVGQRMLGGDRQDGGGSVL